MSSRCPHCTSRNFEVTISQKARVQFKSDGSHEVEDGPYGDLEFDDDSAAVCNRCGWAGFLRDTEAPAQSIAPETKND